MAILLLGGAAAAARFLSAQRTQARHDQLAEAADSVRSRADDAVKSQLSVLEGRASSAATNPVLRAQLGVVDAATLHDGLSTEPWWEPVRKDFPISGLAATEAPDVTIGEIGDLNFTPLIKAARAHQKASSLILGESMAVLAGASIVERGHGGAPFVVLLARPLDAAFLEEVGARTRGGVLLTDGKKILQEAGPAEEQKALETAVGKESQTLFEGEGWVAAASQITPKVWLWSYSKARGLAGDQTGPEAMIAWGIAGLGALVALFVGFKPAPPQPVYEELNDEINEDGRTVVHSNPGAKSSPKIATSSKVRSSPRVQSSPRVSSSPKVRSSPKLQSNPNTTSNSGPGRTSAGKGTNSGASGAAIKPVNRPKQFGRYYLIDRLGEGGMAEVFTAVAFGAENFRRAFVIKLLHGAAQRTESLVEMFIDEAKLASGLVHSNIIPVYDFGKLGDEYYMAQEYVLGRDLRRLTNSVVKTDQKALEPRMAVYIAREALRALEYAHTRTTDDGHPLGIVHRDVSPNNILASARGEVKLFDFGIAKADEGRMHQTQTGVVKGNVQYMSPEQARGESTDARADVYSLGLVLYFLLSGRSLYKGESAYELLIQAAQGLTPELLPRLEKLPPELSDVLRVALEPDREQRFQSAAAFESALAQMPSANAIELAREMQRLFGEELKAEQAKFASVEPPPPEEEEPPAEGGEEEEAR
ncbi:MAG TPA: serine/threonine-protein kinase [Myxococcales bacterium]|nr:serine/threonine-protein kinase [Myxococcales bacterium]